MKNNVTPDQLLIPAMARFYQSTSELAYPLIRLIAGLNLIPHGAQKLFGWFGGDATKTAAFFSQMGLEPALPLVYLVGILEFFGGILLALGLLTRFVAIAVVVFMAVAVFHVHLPNGFFWPEGGFEYPLMWGVIALAIFFRGGGAWSLDAAIGREF